MAAIETIAQASMNLRPSIGLLLSIGEPPDGARNYPKKLDHFRAKPGQMGQYQLAAERFHAEYGPEPRVIDDVFFLSNAIGDVLDVRRKVWGQSGLKAISLTNFATYPASEFRTRIDAWDDELLTFPDDQKDPGRYQLQGPDDPVIAKTKMKVYATLRVALPRVTGIGTVVEISTTGRRSTDNLYASLVYADGIVRGNLIGVPFRLSVRPARMRYWDEKAGKRSTTDFYELVLDTPLTMSEMFEQITTRREALNGDARPLELPPVVHGDVERDAEHIDAFFSDSEEREVDAVLANAEPPASELPEDDEPVEGEIVESSFGETPAGVPLASDQDPFGSESDADVEAAQEAAGYVVKVTNESWVNGLTLAEINARGDDGQEFFRWALSGKNRSAKLKAAAGAYAKVRIPDLHAELLGGDES